MFSHIPAYKKPSNLNTTLPSSASSSTTQSSNSNGALSNAYSLASSYLPSLSAELPSSFPFFNGKQKNNENDDRNSISIGKKAHTGPASSSSSISSSSTSSQLQSVAAPSFHSHSSSSSSRFSSFADASASPFHLAHKSNDGVSGDASQSSRSSSSAIDSSSANKRLFPFSSLSSSGTNTEMLLSESSRDTFSGLNSDSNEELMQQDIRNRASTTIDSHEPKRKRSRRKGANSTKKEIEMNSSSSTVLAKMVQKDDATSPISNNLELECTICLDPITIRGKMDCCDHAYCYKCITNWASEERASCPECSKDIRCIRQLHADGSIQDTFYPHKNPAKDIEAQQKKYIQQQEAINMIKPTKVIKTKGSHRGGRKLDHSSDIYIPTNTQSRYGFMAVPQPPFRSSGMDVFRTSRGPFYQAQPYPASDLNSSSVAATAAVGGVLASSSSSSSPFHPRNPSIRNYIPEPLAIPRPIPFISASYLPSRDPLSLESSDMFSSEDDMQFLDNLFHGNTVPTQMSSSSSLPIQDRSSSSSSSSSLITTTDPFGDGPGIGTEVSLSTSSSSYRGGYHGNEYRLNPYQNRNSNFGVTVPSISSSSSSNSMSSKNQKGSSEDPFVIDDSDSEEI